MGSIFHDYIGGIFIAPKKEEKRLAAGKEKNKNLSQQMKDKVARLKKAAENGDAGAAYSLGIMYLEGKEIGYNPDEAVRILKMGEKLKDFDCSYALALYYKGYWAYVHADAYWSYIYYLAAKDANNATDPKYIKEVNRAIDNDFNIITDEDAKLHFFFKNDIPIK